MTTQQKATLSFSDGTPSVEFPVYQGTVGPDVVDIRKLYGASGKFTFDPVKMTTDRPEVDALLYPTYRKGWEMDAPIA
jgi:hypothetical protein